MKRVITTQGVTIERLCHEDTEQVQAVRLSVGKASLGQVVSTTWIRPWGHPLIWVRRLLNYLNRQRELKSYPRLDSAQESAVFGELVVPVLTALAAPEVPD